MIWIQSVLMPSHSTVVTTLLSYAHIPPQICFCNMDWWNIMEMHSRHILFNSHYRINVHRKICMTKMILLTGSVWNWHHIWFNNLCKQTNLAKIILSDYFFHMLPLTKNKVFPRCRHIVIICWLDDCNTKKRKLFMKMKKK